MKTLFLFATILAIVGLHEAMGAPAESGGEAAREKRQFGGLFGMGGNREPDSIDKAGGYNPFQKVGNWFGGMAGSLPGLNGYLPGGGGSKGVVPGGHYIVDTRPDTSSVYTLPDGSQVITHTTYNG